MKRSMCLLIISLFAASAFAATIQVDQKHVFAGEEFTAVFTADAPLSEGTVTFTIPGQTKVVNVPEMKKGTYTTQVSFTAPEKPGDYEIFSREASAPLVVEKPLLSVGSVEMEPFAIEPRESSQLVFTIKNVGDYAIYNVRARAAVVGSADKYEFDGGWMELFGTMEPGAEVTRRVDFKAKESAGGKDAIQLVLSYEFDKEEHTLERFADLQVGGFPLLEVAVLIIIMLVVGKFVLTRVAA